MSLRERLDELSYPCEYPFKLVFGLRGTLEDEIHQALLGALGSERQWTMSVQPSRTGRYLSVTIRLEVRSAIEVEQLHHLLAGLPGVLVQL